MSQLLRCSSVGLLAAMIGGCMTIAVEVPTTRFPIPVVEQIPFNIGLSLPAELTSYVFEEDLGDNGAFKIHIGQAQEVLFTNLLTGMFAGVQLIDDPTQPGTDVAAVLVPRISEMQFSTPYQTRTDYFEVWIKYDFRLYDHDGAVIGEWPLTAYGKANTQNYGLATTEPTVREAALAASRDTMAFFTVQFRTIPAVQQWLAAKRGGKST